MYKVTLHITKLEFPDLAAPWNSSQCRGSSTHHSLNFWLCSRLLMHRHTFSNHFFRHAKSREPGNLVPGHFWSKIFRNLRFKEVNLKLCSGFVKYRFKWMTVLLHFYLKHHNIYSYNTLFCKFVQMNCPYIPKSKFRFPDKNNLFACLHFFCLSHKTFPILDHFSGAKNLFYFWL